MLKHALLLLSLFSGCAFADSDECDVTPGESTMMKSLRPASAMIMGCIDQLNNFPIKASILFEIVMNVCKKWKTCGSVVNNSTLSCVIDMATEHLKSFDRQLTHPVTGTAAELFSCMFGAMPKDQSDIVGSFHWVFLLLK